MSGKDSSQPLRPSAHRFSAVNIRRWHPLVSPASWGHSSTYNLSRQIPSDNTRYHHVLKTRIAERRWIKSLGPLDEGCSPRRSASRARQTSFSRCYSHALRGPVPYDKMKSFYVPIKARDMADGYLIEIELFLIQIKLCYSFIIHSLSRTIWHGASLERRTHGVLRSSIVPAIHDESVVSG